MIETGFRYRKPVYFFDSKTDSIVSTLYWGIGMLHWIAVILFFIKKLFMCYMAGIPFYGASGKIIVLYLRRMFPCNVSEFCL